jgi:N4-gp56 family major capsid protein
MQDTGDAGLAALLNTYYTKRALERMVPQLHFYESAEKRPLPKGTGKTIDFFRWTNLSRIKSNLTELTAPTQIGLSSARVTATLIQRGSYSMIDELVDLTARSPMVEAQVDLHSEEAAKTVDGYIADVIGFRVADVVKRSSLRVNHGGTLNSTGIGVRIYSGSDDTDSFPMYINKTRITTSATVVGTTKSALSLKAILHGVSILKGRDAQPMADGYYHGFLHPVCEYHLMSGTGWKGWLKYTDPSPVRSYATGIIAGVKFFISSAAPRFALSGDTLATGTAAIHGTIIVGRGAYGVTEIPESGQSQGFRMYVKKSGDQSTADPINQKMTCGRIKFQPHVKNNENSVNLQNGQHRAELQNEEGVETMYVATIVEDIVRTIQECIEHDRNAHAELRMAA